ncbi:hypothetical protein [Pendulispora albinea]|uniref:Antibiotic biosynthesis monooxygenase n=1 Tax=Pendulispora albinea TaxID=2741071 RepID=A0ABZ2M2F4_9BACT
MTVWMIRYQVAEEGVAEVIRAVEAVFEAVRAKRPEGIRYAYYRRTGSTELVATLELDGAENPLFGIAAARELQATVAKWVVGEAPAPQPLDLLGAYGYDSLPEAARRPRTN